MSLVRFIFVWSGLVLLGLAVCLVLGIRLLVKR